MGIRRLATNEDDFLVKLYDLFRKGTLDGDRIIPVYVQIPGTPKMFTKVGTDWKIIINDGCSLRAAKSYEVDEVLDAIHEDCVSVYSCTKWNLGTPIHPVSILHDCHNRGWREEYET